MFKGMTTMRLHTMSVIDLLATAMSHYDTLRVPRDATQEEIETAFQTWKWTYNPETCRDPAAAHQALGAIFIAYRVLHDPDWRREYDQLKERQQWRDFPVENPIISDKEFAYWVKAGPVTERLAATIRREQAQRESNARAKSRKHVVETVDHSLDWMFSFFGAIFYVGLFVGLVWILITAVRWFWIHPLW
jgi:DnaJ-class molecular chaperone